MSLYTKYRPQNFANLVGQEHVRETILHEIQQHTFAHAYLFAGPRGTGKTSTARLIAKALNCTNKNPEGEPCDTCDFCTTIKEGSLIDVIEIDAASNRGIDEIRDLKEKIQFAPSRAKTKTYIIDEVHMLTKEAFNALLKTLEEPPENVYFILCTTEIHKIPETIISRCQRFDFKRIDVKTIMTRLSYIAQLEGIQAEDAAIELIARHVEGGMRDAIGLLEQMTMDNKLLSQHVRSHLGITGHDTIITLLDVLEKKDLTKALHIINQVHNEGYDLTSFVREVLECLREKLISGIQQGRADSSVWLVMIEKFEEARDMLRTTVIPQLPLEIAAIQLCGAQGVISAETQENTARTPSKEVEKPKEQKLQEPDPVSFQKSEEGTKAEVETVEVLKQEYQLDENGLSKHWPRVLEHISPPSLRRSLGESRVSEKSDNTVSLIFTSRFHMEKGNQAESKVKVEKAIHHLFGKTVKVTCELDLTAVKLVENTATEPAAEVRILVPEKKKKSQNGNLAKKAMEIFGDDE